MVGTIVHSHDLVNVLHLCTYKSVRQGFHVCAGGCFWGLELAYQRVPGVIKTSVGYTGGHDPTPNYNSVCAGRTRHAEAVQVRGTAADVPRLAV